MTNGEVFGCAWLAIAAIEMIFGYAQFAVTQKQKIYDPTGSCIGILAMAMLFPALWLCRLIKFFIWICQRARPELYEEKMTFTEIFLLSFDTVPSID